MGNIWETDEKEMKKGEEGVGGGRGLGNISLAATSILGCIH